jgi:hypothetical protein
MQGDINQFEDTLASVLRHRPDRAQVIVVHDGNYDDPYQLSEEVELVSIDGRPQLIRLFNRGLQAADGQWVVLIRPGMQIDDNWHIAVEDVVDDFQIGSVAPVIVNVNRPTKIIAAGVHSDRFNNRILTASQARIAPKCLASISPLGPTSWLAVYRRDLLSAIGTLDERMDPHYMDLDIAMALKQLGFKCALQPDLIGEMESELPIRREASLPHGFSAQRAFRRYPGPGGNRHNMWLAYAAEFVRGAAHPVWLRHMFQRRAANPLANIDRQFADQLVSVKTRQAWNALPLQPETQSKAAKRAA